MKRDHEKFIIDQSMVELFEAEVASQTNLLTQNLLALEKTPEHPPVMEALMRAAHSLKGAARLMDVSAIEKIAHGLEDVFVSAQRGEIKVSAEAVDVCLRTVDIMRRLVVAGSGANAAELVKDVNNLVGALKSVSQGKAPKKIVEREAPKLSEQDAAFSTEISSSNEPDRVLRVSALRLNRILGMSSELVVDANHAQEHVQSLLQMKKKHNELMKSLDFLRDASLDHTFDERVKTYLTQARQRAADFRSMFSEYYVQVDEFERRLNTTAARIHREVMLTRMRPFADGVNGFQRMVRDLARGAGKKAELQVQGLRIDVDRDVLDRLEAPLTHLLRNAVDHGIEFPAERLKLNKSEHGTIRLSASYSGGKLLITLEDDGRGVDFERLKATIIDGGMSSAEMVDKLTRDELLEFLYLPKFSTRAEVTELSGRGVGLDVVRDAVHDMGGTVQTSTTPGQGTRFVLQLPITLSLIPALLVEVAEESYAFPLSRVDRLLSLAASSTRYIEGHLYAVVDGENIGLVYASGIFNKSQIEPRDALSIVLLSDRLSRYGVIVDKIVGERVLAVQALDARLGQVRDISAAALLDDGTPTLIINVDDFVRSISSASRGGTLQQTTRRVDKKAPRVEKRILVVDDSITVRGVESKLLESRGYVVSTAVDGMDGWNRVRSEAFDLVITDVDMPRMDGVELVHMIKGDQQLRTIPVMIVSYKDSVEDRQRGLDAGADYYLTKGSFHDETLVDAVIDLIGQVG